MQIAKTNLQMSAATESPICVLMYEAVNVLDDRTLLVGQLIDSELERMWKEAVMSLRIFLSYKCKKNLGHKL